MRSAKNITIKIIAWIFFILITPVGSFNRKIDKIIPVVKWLSVVTFLGCVLMPDVLYAQDKPVNTDVLSLIQSTFDTKTKAWAPVLEGAAKSLFRVLLIVDVAWMGVRMVLKPAEIKEIFVEFAKLLMFAGFMYSLIVHYKKWANLIIGGLQQLAGKAAPKAPIADPMKIFNAAINLAIDVFDKMSWTAIVSGIGLAICCIVVSVCFALIAAQVILIKCEAYIVLNAGIIILGFGGSQFTKEYSVNFLKYALGVAVKLYVMQLLVAIGIDFVTSITSVSDDPKIQEVLVVIGASIVLLALVQSLPDVASGIINGAHVNTGQAINSAVTSVGMATMAAMTGGASAAAGAVQGTATSVSALREASQFASAEGKTGMGKLGHMAGTLKNAASAHNNEMSSRNPSFSKGVASKVAAQHESFKQEQKAAEEAAKANKTGDGEG